MRAKGTISGWKDSQGFGFILPEAGGDKLFVHRNAFKNRKRSPADGVQVTYEVASDQKRRRPHASNVIFAIDMQTGDGARRSASSGIAIWLPLMFVTLLAALTFKGRLPASILGAYLAVSLISFCAYAIDKSAARSGRWRTAETALHLLDLCNGWPGGLMAQRWLRHKSSKASFQGRFWATVLVNCAVLGWLLTASGTAWLRQWL